MGNADDVVTHCVASGRRILGSLSALSDALSHLLGTTGDAIPSLVLSLSMPFSAQSLCLSFRLSVFPSVFPSVCLSARPTR